MNMFGKYALSYYLVWERFGPWSNTGLKPLVIVIDGILNFVK